MKYFNKILILVLLFLAIKFSLNAQIKSPKISGIFNYTKNIPDSIALWTYPKKNSWNSSTDYFVKIENKKFSFKFPTITAPLLFQLVFHVGTGGDLLGEFYIDSDDSIKVKIFDQKIKSGLYSPRDSIVFYGRGSSKYNLIESLNKDVSKYMRDKTLWPPKRINSIDSLDLFLKHNYRVTNQFISKKNDLIKSYNCIDSSMKMLINYQYANYNLYWADRIRMLYESNKDNEFIKIKIREYFNNHFDEFFVKKVNDVVLSSPSYFSTINSVFKTKELINNIEGIIDFEKHYNILKNLYTGKIRERMLSQLFKDSYGTYELSNISTKYDSLIKDASRYLVSEQGKEIIAEKLTFKKGTKIANGDFLDLNGNIVNVNQLKGKVFLLEMWGLGCGACAAFHYKFEQELWPKLKYYKDFIVLSIYDGKTMSNWLKGIESNLYTSKEYLNLSTLPWGSANHPFFKYYNVNYAPFLLLVDKNGNIVSNFRPSIESRELLALIDTALKENKMSK